MPNDIKSYLSDHLNDEQLTAATCTDQHSLIIAGAGSGKTRTLTFKIAYLLHEKNVNPEEILGVTFTNKAAHEMKERLLEILDEIEKQNGESRSENGEDEGEGEKGSNSNGGYENSFEALIGEMETSSGQYSRHDFNRIGTFHSIFLKVLKQDIDQLGKGYTKSFSIYDSNDQKKLLKSVIKELNMNDQIDTREAQRKISHWKNSGRLPEQAGYKCENQTDEWILKIYQHYQQELESANALDFDDLLLLTKELFTSNSDILQKRQDQFSYVLVDEAQDTNAIQFELIRMISKDSVVTLIGDDYQSIYRWRGALMEQFLNVQELWPEIKIFKLQTNYRSLPHIVQAGNAIIKQNKKQYDKDVYAHREGDRYIRVFEFADEIDEAEQIISLITKLKEEKNKDRNDFTILYRTNAQSNPFEQVLLTEGIPYKVVGAYKFFERKEIKDMISYLKLWVNPHDNVALKRVINTPSRRIGAATLEELETVANDQECSLGELLLDFSQYRANLSDGTAKKLQPFAQLMKRYTSIADDKPIGELLEELVKAINYEKYLVKQDGEEKAEERMENIGQLINMAYSVEQQGIAGLNKFLDDISLLTSLEELQTEEADAIKLMTVHSSKGLEFSYVFIVGLEENIFPLSKAKFDDDELEEERRGMYVAITRAQDHLFLSHAQSRRQRGQIKYNPPSRFLEEIPDQLCKVYNMSTGNARQSKQQVTDINEGDQIKHKLFGTGKVLEVRTNVAVVKFDNPKFSIRKLETKNLEKV